MRIEDAIHQHRFASAFAKATVNVLYTHSWLTGHFGRLFKKHGISLQQFNILRILRGQHPQPASINLLIERMLDKQSNASRLVEKLRQKGLVERKLCGTDRRRVDVVITPHGLEVLALLDAEMQRLEARLNQLSEAEALQLSDLLDRLRSSEGPPSGSA